MCGQQQEEIVSIKRKPVDDLQKKTDSKKARITSTYSNNMVDSVKTFCCECAKVVTISGLEEHILSHNKMTIKEYRRSYGNPRTQIIQLVFHNCGLCTQDVLLDSNSIEKHVKNFHQMGFIAYSSKYLAAAKENSRVIIQCSQCFKTFKRNIQLKAHSKRHTMSDIDSVGFYGFKGIGHHEKKQCLDELIKTMDTTSHKEKQAFQQLLKLTY